MADNKIKALYDVSSKDYNLGTLDEFTQKLQNPEKRKLLYEHIGKEYNLGEYQDFESKVVTTPTEGAKKKWSNPKWERFIGWLRSCPIKFRSPIYFE